MLLGRTGQTRQKKEGLCGEMELVGELKRFLGLNLIRFGSFNHSQARIYGYITSFKNL
jgi:hypothetical protein